MNIFKKLSESKYIYIYSASLVTLIFLITRLPYFLNYPVIILSFDSASYVAAALELINFKAPLFDIRTPGYPLFLAIVWSISESIYFSSLIQSFLTLAVSLFFLKVIEKSYRSFTFLFAISLSAYISSSYFLILEPSVLTESLFTTFLILSTSFLISALKKGSNVSWLMFSVSVAVLIMVRPAGLYMVSVILIILIFFRINKYSLKYFLYLLIPFSVLILSLCLYNYVTLNSFTITPFGEANLAGVTILFMEPSESYPEKVNSAIKKTLDSIPRKNISTIKNSYNLSNLYNTFKDDFYRQINFADNLIKNDSTMTYMNIQPIFRKVSVDAIKNNPVIYAKFFICNFYYFFMNIRIPMSYFETLLTTYQKVYLEKNFVKDLESKKWKQLSSDKSFETIVKDFYNEQTGSERSNMGITITGDKKASFNPSILKTIYEYYEVSYNLIFRNILWLLLFFTVAFLSFKRLLKSGFKDINSFLIFLFPVMFISNAILVSLVESSLVRYSYTVEFVIFFSLPFLIILLSDKKNILKTNSQNI